MVKTNKTKNKAIVFAKVKVDTTHNIVYKRCRGVSTEILLRKKRKNKRLGWDVENAYELSSGQKSGTLVIQVLFDVQSLIILRLFFGTTLITHHTLDDFRNCSATVCRLDEKLK